MSPKYCAVVSTHILLLVACLGCGSGIGPSSNLQIDPSSATLATTQQTQLHATVSNQGSTQIDVTSEATWKVSSQTLASVSKEGIFTCNAAGSTQLLVTYKGMVASASLNCLSPVSLNIIGPGLLTLGQPGQFSALASYANGLSLDVTAAAAWSSSNSGLAGITPQGVVTCSAPGSLLISTIYNGIIRTSSVTCTAPSLNTPSYFMEASDDFVGPFPNWVNVKTAFGAVGDGQTDDTASIQHAINSLRNSGSPPVLYFPAGVYITKQPLTITHTQFFSLIGEDPSKTILKWDGAQGGTILQTDASTEFRISRISFDGSGIADTAENITTLTNTPGGYYSTSDELSDQHIQGVNVGIRLGVDAETTIERVFFDNISSYGVTVETFNTLNIFINDSLFVNCGTGVSNVGGAGHFMVSNSFFSHSQQADMSIQNALYFSARHNTSVSSGAFFDALPGGANPALITIQNNTILDPERSPLILGNLGPMMIIDNVIRIQNPLLSAIGVYHDPTSPKAFFSFGNIYTNNAPPTVYAGPSYQWGQLDSYDDSVTSPSNIPDVVVPTNVYIPPNLHPAVYEVPANGTGADIQQAINNAIASGLPRPVVHIPFGNHTVGETITVPAGSNLELIGDDVSKSALYWNGPALSPVLNIDTSNVSVKYLAILGGSDGIRLSVADQPDTQIVVDQAQLQKNNSESINFDGVEHLTAEFLSTYTMGAVTGVRVTGAAYRQAGEGTVGSTNIYSGSMQSSPTSTSFDVSAYGKYMVQDDWHDAGLTGPRNFILNGNGIVTEQSGSISNTSAPFEIDHFNGKISLIGLQGPLSFITNPGSTKSSLLNLGLDNMGNATFLPQSEGNLVVQNMLDSYYDHAGHQIPDIGTPETEWLRGMLAQVRTEYPVQRLPMLAGASRLRLNRIWIGSTTTAIHILPDIPMTSLYYTIEANDMLLGDDVAGGNPACNGLALGSVPTSYSQWSLIDTGDGDFLLLALSANKALGIAIANGTTPRLEMDNVDYSYSQRWQVINVGDGRMQFLNRATNDVLGVSTNGCADLGTSDSEENSKWTLTAH